MLISDICGEVRAKGIHLSASPSLAYIPFIAVLLFIIHYNVYCILGYNTMYKLYIPLYINHLSYYKDTFLSWYMQEIYHSFSTI